jgi:hypothetical protein
LSPDLKNEKIRRSLICPAIFADRAARRNLFDGESLTMQIPVKLKNGGTFYVEVEDASGSVELIPGGAPMGSGSKEATATEQRFSEAVRVVEGIADEVTEGLIKKEDSSKRLSEVGLEIQIGFDAQGKVLFFASAKASAVMKLNLKWTIPSSK